jgi:hypothetical protein
MSTEQLPAAPMDDQVQNEKACPGAALQAPPPAPAARIKVPRLTSIAAVRKEMARQYGQQLRGEIDSQTLTRRIYALSAIREAFRDDEVERRLAAIEERLGANQSTRR